MSDGGAGRRAVRARVGGRVQGVGFRYFVIRAAEAHGVSGYVRNLEDGGLEVRAEGASEDVAAFLAAIRPGPRHARVESFETLELDPTNAFRGFGVRY